MYISFFAQAWDYLASKLPTCIYVCTPEQAELSEGVNVTALLVLQYMQYHIAGNIYWQNLNLAVASRV